MLGLSITGLVLGIGGAAFGGFVSAEVFCCSLVSAVSALLCLIGSRIMKERVLMAGAFIGFMIAGFYMYLMVLILISVHPKMM